MTMVVDVIKRTQGCLSAQRRPSVVLQNHRSSGRSSSCSSSTASPSLFHSSRRRSEKLAHVRMQAKSRPTKPDDSPRRDGNRDRLVGLLTQRACRTLLFYCSETNQHMYHWLNAFIKENPIPREGKVEDISGETFLMTLMQQPPEQARAQPWLDPIFDCSKPLTVDPRQVAQRLMDIRVAIAKEFQEDLNRIEEENMEMLRQSLMVSLEAQATSHPVVPDPKTDTGEQEGSA